MVKKQWPRRGWTLEITIFHGLLIAALMTFIGACSLLSQRTVRVDKLTYHNDPQRTGWNSNEISLLPQTVASSRFGLMWRSEPFDLYNGLPPRLYATPLYVDKVEITAGDHRGKFLSVLYAVTSVAYVYAVSAFAAPEIPPGTILWRVRLAEKPCSGGAFGNLSTPVIDLWKGRIYVTSCDDVEHWRAHALDLRNGNEIVGWPVKINRAAVNAPGVSKNGSAQYPDKLGNLQRGALNLSPDGSRLYATFGGEAGGAGWIVAIDTVHARVASAFSSTAVSEERQGGIWASGGPAIDREGRIHVTTGASVVVALNKLGLMGVFPKSLHNWGQSMIQLTDSPEKGLELTGTYTPFNYCQAAMADIDLGSSGITIIDVDSRITSTSHLLAFGGKQGNAYLLDRARLPGDLVRRQSCSEDPSSDRSLLAPEDQPQFGSRGPINLFGPYSDLYGMGDQARSRTTPAYFRAEGGKSYVFMSGSAKTGEHLMTSTPPGLARLEIMTAPGKAAYLRIDQLELTQTFHNPGSPVVTSDGGKDAIVWVLDANAPKSVPLYGSEPPQPILYAFDALTFKLLWKSSPGALGTSGKYNEPTAVRGTVFVGANRIVAFGLGNSRTNTEQKSPNVIPPELSDTSFSDKKFPVCEIDGEQLYNQRCAMCHSSGQPGIPRRSALATLGRERIFRTLLHGAMQVQAFGLSEAELGALAACLSSSN